MREIKFRAKYSRSGEWRYGYLVLSDCKNHGVIINHGDTYSEYDIDPKTAGQYTGLKDKNGVEIYEGDIVVVNESHKLLKADFGKNKRVVQWRECGACLDMLHVDYLEVERKIGLTFDNGMIDAIEVIGNIYENTELLEKSK